MARNSLLVVAALLLTGIASEAVAAEEKKQQSKNAAKVLATLQMFGIKDSRIKSLIEEVDKHVEGRYLRITEERWDTNRVVLRYKLGTRMGMRQLEMMYTPSHKSNYSITAGTTGIMFNYHIDLR